MLQVSSKFPEKFLSNVSMVEDTVDRSILPPSASTQEAWKKLQIFESKAGEFGIWSDDLRSYYLSLLVFFGFFPKARELAWQRHLSMPQDPQAAFAFARFLLYENEADGLKWYADLSGRNSGWMWTLCLAKLHLEVGQYESAFSMLGDVSSRAPYDYDILYQLAFNSKCAPGLDPAMSLELLRKAVLGQLGRSCEPVGSVARRPRYTIGFVCGSLRKHAISTFFMPLLANLDRKTFMVVIFSSNAQPDGVTAELQEMCDLWYDVSKVHDQELLELIRSDRMDVLIDLDNHTKANRMWVFSQRAAPIQMSFYGLNLSTGVDSVDYRLTDAVVDPPGNESHYTEKLLRTRSCHIAYMGTTFEPSSQPFFENGFFTFGSFNQRRKVNPALVSAWAELLRAHPESRLHVVGFDDGLSRLRLERWMREAGIDLRRVAIEGVIDPRELYQRIQSVDLAIDTWPFGGGVTTAMTLSLGVPVLTATGPRAQSRVSASMLRELGMERYIVDSPDQLAARAAEICADPEALNADRAKIAEGFSRTIGNGERLAAEVGELLIRAIERYRKGKPADHDSL
jgi:hypothetical protein